MLGQIQFDPKQAANQLLYLVETVLKQFEQNDASISKYDSERGDLDHIVELTSYNAAEGYQLVRKIRENRRKRRICKDENHAMKTLYEYIKRNEGLLRDLRAIVKATEKQVAFLDSRQYHPRTGVITANEFEQKRVRS